MADQQVVDNVRSHLLHLIGLPSIGRVQYGDAFEPFDHDYVCSLGEKCYHFGDYGDHLGVACVICQERGLIDPFDEAVVGWHPNRGQSWFQLASVALFGGKGVGE